MIENKQRYIIDFHDFPNKRRSMPELEVGKRIDNLEEVELGLTQEDAQKEAQRCLSCRRCLGCALCLAVCEPKAIVFEQEDEILEVVVDDIIVAPEAGLFMASADKTLGFGKYKNVVCAFELERMLEKDGPTAGLVMRPFDGEIPEKIAIVLDNGINGSEESNALVSYTFEIAALAMKNTDGLSISLITPEKAQIESKEGIAVKKAEVKEIKEIEDTGNLETSFVENGNESKEQYDMIVLANLPEVLPEIEELKKKVS